MSLRDAKEAAQDIVAGAAGAVVIATSSKAVHRATSKKKDKNGK